MRVRRTVISVFIKFRNPKPLLDLHLLISNAGGLPLTASYLDPVSFNSDGNRSGGSVGLLVGLVSSSSSI